MKQVVIIGNGVAGITAARHIRKRSDCHITVISSETPHFFSRTALMYVYMGHLTFAQTKPYEDAFWKKNRIDLLFDHAETLDTKAHSLTLRSGSKVPYDRLIIATGSRSNMLQIPGIELAGVQALYSYDDLLSMQANTKDIGRAVVVGGGLIGVEMAEMLHSKGVHTTMLIRERAFWNNVLPLPEATLISKHIISHGVGIRHETELARVVADEHGRVRAVMTDKGDEIPCQFAGIAVGVQPNVHWLRNSGLHIDRGIRVNEYLETSVPDVYAIGDCVERTEEIHGRKKIEQVWYTARMMGETVARTICGDKTAYTPGPWFNSAKFFDIEFQTYGQVDRELSPDHEEYYWEHPSARKAIHMVWHKSTLAFIGINTFGIRMRHECFDRWLRQRQTIDYVLDHLSEANFDPEFANRHENEIKAGFTKRTSTSIQY